MSVPDASTAPAAPARGRLRARAAAAGQRFSALARRLVTAGRRLRPAEHGDAPGRDAPAEAATAGGAETRLGRALLAASAFHAGQTGVLPLAEGLDAFAARVLLADAAERTLDVQYYIWRADTSGLLLLQALHRAADRGVRVRLLLDDNNTTGLDDCLAALDAHPRAEVRLFNPFRQRRWRMLGYLVDFARLNRRMHNKSFTVDDQVTIVGGRNVGDEYFDASDETRFVDLDVLAVGAVVPDVTADFERYWACASAHPLSAVVPVAAPGALEALEARTAAVETGPAAQDYVEALLDSPLVADLVAGQLALDWTSAQLLSDDPAKGLGRAAAATLLPRRIAEALRGAERELNLVSPYFVPGRGGVAALASVRAGGARVTVLTNALEATDVVAVHAGYARYRRALLRAGVRLFEMTRRVAPANPRPRRGVGSSASSLHAKTFSIDDRRVFVGSFNFDPRSARLNTEMGLVIDSAPLARRIAALFEEPVPREAYEVRLGRFGGLRWIERGADGTVREHRHEPGSTLRRRCVLWLVSRLPVEHLL